MCVQVTSNTLLLCQWVILTSALTFLLKDTTDYVAYVAKDPVNRRGMCLFLWHFTVHPFLMSQFQCAFRTCVAVVLNSVSHPGVFRRFGPGCHQHHRPGLWPALPTVFTVSFKQTPLHTWQVRHSWSWYTHSSHTQRKAIQSARQDGRHANPVQSVLFLSECKHDQILYSQGIKHGGSSMDGGRGGVGRTPLL